MELVKLTELNTSYSLSIEDKPSNVWAYSLDTHGIPGHIIETLSSDSHSWTGWGFKNNKAWLLFEAKEDAIMAKIRFGEINNVN